MAETMVKESSPRSSDDGLAEARPEVDPAAMGEALAVVRARMFGTAQSSTLGRFILRGKIGAGGMGVVHAAYDPELRRPVALKVLHPARNGDEDAHDRLRNEAAVLARLKHDNVVKIWDVLFEGGQSVIVMELVEGTTLADWHAPGHRRSWREIVDVYAQAGDGLAAAHGADVIHRDFKPANVIVGKDGKVRVLDFGLARLARSFATPEPHAAEVPAAPVDGSLTATGVVVGTRSYTAPELLDGGEASAASDQFSFCVSMHHALEGVAPFGGSDDPRVRAANIRAGAIARATDGRRLPAWLRATVGRGLSADPGARHPSIPALVSELRRTRGWRRWRVPVAIGSLALIAGYALVTRRHAAAALPPCDGGVNDAMAMWGDSQRTEIAGVLARVAAEGDNHLADHLFPRLDEYRGTLVRMRRDACEAYRHGATTDLHYDRQTNCLKSRLGDLASAAKVLRELDSHTVDTARVVVDGMPPVGTCFDDAALTARYRPPPPAIATRVDSIRAQVSDAGALERAGRLDDALREASRALDDAHEVSYPPVVVEAALAKGRIQMFGDDSELAIPALREAQQTASRLRLMPEAIEAVARRIFVVGTDDGGAGIAGIADDIESWVALSEGDPDDHFARPLLLNNIGSVYMAKNIDSADMAKQQRLQAKEYFQRAKDALVGDSALELFVIDKNLAMVTPDDRARRALTMAAADKLRERVGESYSLSIDALDDSSLYLTDPSEAALLAERACALRDAHQSGQLPRRAHCHYHHAWLIEETGDAPRAAALYRKVAVLASADSRSAAWGQLASGRAALIEGNIDEAIAHFTRLVVDNAGRPEWWNWRFAVHGNLGLGLAEHRRGNDPAAAAHLEAAIARYEILTQMNENMEHHQCLAQARWALAAVRRHLGEPERAAELERLARAFYQRGGQSAYRRYLDVSSP